MDWKLELIAVPVSDVDRSIEFYAEKVGFNLDHVLADRVVMVEVEPDLLRVELDRAIDVTHGHRDQFQLPVHGFSFRLMEPSLCAN